MVTLLSGLNCVNAAVVKATGESSDPQGVVRSRRCAKKGEKDTGRQRTRVYIERGRGEKSLVR